MKRFYTTGLIFVVACGIWISSYSQSTSILEPHSMPVTHNVGFSSLSQIR